MSIHNKTIQINGLNISYLDNEIRSTQTLVFIHGNSMNAKSFENQLNDASLNTFHLLALDFPGHGNSERTQNYSLSLFANILSEFCEKMQLSNYVVIAHSLGGHIAIQSLPQLKKCIGAFLMGTPPLKLPLNLDEAFLPHPAMALLFKKKLDDQEVATFADSLTDYKNKSYLQKSIKSTDASFREDLIISIQNGDIKNEVAILYKAEIPIALLLGENDRLVNTNYVQSLQLSTLWNNEIMVVEKCSHCPHLETPQVLNKLLVEFIAMLSIKN